MGFSADAEQLGDLGFKVAGGALATSAEAAGRVGVNGVAGVAGDAADPKLPAPATGGAMATGAGGGAIAAATAAADAVDPKLPDEVVTSASCC